MPITFQGNRINVFPGAPCFVVASNFCDEFEIGHQSTTKYWLLAEMMGPPVEFLFNGRIFVPGISDAGTVIDNFPKGPTPRGWVKRPRADGNGFELWAPQSQEVLFGYEVTHNVCRVTTNLYDENGDLVAETLGSDFVVHRAPLRMGRSGLVIV